MISHLYDENIVIKWSSYIGIGIGIGFFYSRYIGYRNIG